MGSRKKGEPRRPGESEAVARDFGPCRVRVNLRTGDVRVMEFAEVDDYLRNDATAWAMRQLAAVGLPVTDPLSLRDAMWG